MSEFQEYALLKDGEVIPTNDYREWAKMFADMETRRIAFTALDGAEISTVFLGMNHAFTADVEPLWFETMVFGRVLDQEMDRYTTLEEARQGHENMVRRVQEALVASAPASEQAEAGAGDIVMNRSYIADYVAEGNFDRVWRVIEHLQVQLSTEQAMRALSDERGNDFEAECQRLQAELAAANERAAVSVISSYPAEFLTRIAKNLDEISVRGWESRHAQAIGVATRIIVELAALKPAASQDAGEG